MPVKGSSQQKPCRIACRCIFASCCHLKEEWTTVTQCVRRYNYLREGRRWKESYRETGQRVDVWRGRPWRGRRR